jgi:hypothetical protein
LTDELFPPLEDNCANLDVDDYIGNDDNPDWAVEGGYPERIPLRTDPAPKLVNESQLGVNERTTILTFALP